MNSNNKIKKNKKSFWWYWKRFWDNYYRIYDSNNKVIKEVLVYHKKIYLLEDYLVKES